MSACTTTRQQPYQTPQIDARLRVVGHELPKMAAGSTVADSLNLRIESDQIVTMMDAQIRAILQAVGVEMIELKKDRK